MTQNFSLRIMRVHSESCLRHVYSLRYRAYRREEAIGVNPTELFKDRYDEQRNHIIWALASGKQIVGSIRTMWGTNGVESKPSTPELDAYSDLVAPVAGPDFCLVSGNRFVTDPDDLSVGRRHLMLLMRYHLLATKHVSKDFPNVVALAAVRDHHVAWYERVLKLRKIPGAPPRIFPNLNAEMYLLHNRYRDNIGDVHQSFPVLRDRIEDWRLLDESQKDSWEEGIVCEG